MPQHRRSLVVPRGYCNCQPSTAPRPVVERGTLQKDGEDRRQCCASSARECGSHKAKHTSRASKGRVRSLVRELDSAMSIPVVASVPRDQYPCSCSCRNRSRAPRCNKPSAASGGHGSYLGISCHHRRSCTTVEDNPEPTYWIAIKRYCRHGG